MKMLSLENMPSTSAVLSAYTSFTASAVLVRAVLMEFRSIANQLLPGQIRVKILSKFGGLFGKITPKMSVIIDENNGFRMKNEIFEASEVYLRTKLGPSSMNMLKVFKAPQEKGFSFIISRGEKIIDEFQGEEFVWELKVYKSEKSGNVELRSFELTFNKKCREMVFASYLPFVLERSKAIHEANKVIKIHSLGKQYGEVKLDHPSTFDTLAMDPEMKKELIEDLDRFVRRKDYYRRVGKAWKRGYLLYGPPGTGKSSLIAAMANYLNFDVYDLDLSTGRDIQSLVVTTKNRSVLVIEDIDCMELQNRVNDNAKTYPHHNKSDKSNKVPLSNLLNFIDGLWSCCGDERIIVFTTNYKDRLDPALLRPGRMDMHIHMSYCTPGGFRVLASNYHGLKDHFKFGEVDKLIEEVNVTPAEIAEELMKSDKADVALEGLIKFMEKKKVENDELKEGSDDGGMSDVSKKNKKRKKGNKVGTNLKRIRREGSLSPKLEYFSTTESPKELLRNN